MKVSTITQPGTQLGNEISKLLDSQVKYKRIAFVSAWVALRTILRLRERLLAQVEAGAKLTLTVGIDLGGTSREVLEELLRWNCQTFIFHNPNPRSTFHPKLYLFEAPDAATLFLGSNNLTEGGFYTNYEAMSRYDLRLPSDKKRYKALLAPLASYIKPQGGTVNALNDKLIHNLIARGELPTEEEARKRRRDQAGNRAARRKGSPPSSFLPVAVPLPPLLPDSVRREEPLNEERSETHSESLGPPKLSTAILVWRKRLPKSDALEVGKRSNPVGGVRLTQARFKGRDGNRIDQTPYFRQLFADYNWEVEPRKHKNQEHTFISMRIRIKGRDYGIRNFEISHKPTGEAGQKNYTSILRWGREFSPVIKKQNLTGSTLSLYETPDQDALFLIDIK